MVIKKNKVSVFIAITRYHAIVMLSFLVSFGLSLDAHETIINVAWAEEAPCPVPNPLQQETQPSPGKIPDALKNQTTTLPDKNKESLPSNTLLMPGASETETNFVDILHGGISQELMDTATWLDSFFADERYEKEPNESYIRVRYDIVDEERSKTLYQPTYNVRLILPQLQKKTHLVFSAEPPETPQNTLAPESTTGARVGTIQPEERNFTTALHYFYRSTPEESIIIRTGALFSHGSPVVFIAPRYRSLTNLRIWDFRFSQEATYRTDTQWQAETGFDLERLLSHDFFFRTSLVGDWYANKKGYFYSLGCSLRQTLNQNNVLQYEWGNSYQTSPSDELTAIAFSIRYRHSVWRQWLFFELAPQYRFPRDRNFNGTPGILFRFEIYFGRKA